MKNIKISKLLGASAAAMASSVVFSTMSGAQDMSSVTSLPVILDDCGAVSCRDRRDLDSTAISALLSAAIAAENNAGGNGNGGGNGNTSSGGNGQGLALGNGVNDTQVVYLDFAQSSPTFPATIFGGVQANFVSHTYTAAERDAVQANLEAAYSGFNVSFTQDVPASGEFSTLNFECGNASGQCIDFGGGILFGRAQHIDIRNDIRDDSAFVDANLWEVLVQLDPSGNFFTAISGIPVVGGDVQAALSIAIVNQASNTGAHELGHNMGLRHHDSFGAPGTGIPSTGVPDPSAFFPTFDGPQNGDEGILHTMASGASVGSGFTDSTTRIRFFSERSVIKLAAGERGRLLAESDVSGGNKKLHLRNVVAPNTIEIGDNAEGSLDIREALIAGRIDVANEIDSYRFKAKAGQSLSAEFNGFDVPRGEAVIGALSLYFVEDDGSHTLVAQNFQNFEGFDAFLVDAPIERSGDYVMEVSAPDILLLGGGLFSLEANGFGTLRTGDYEVSIYIVDGKPGAGPSSVPGPTS